MNSCVKGSFSKIVAGIGRLCTVAVWMAANQGMAQVFTTLHSFTGSDGNYPNGSLVLIGDTLYGTTAAGTVFAVNTDGTGFTNLYRFSDGWPGAGVISSGSTLYGTTVTGGNYGTGSGGNSGNGTVFTVGTNGAGFLSLYEFTGGEVFGGGGVLNSDGAAPWGGLILSSNTLYGTAESGGDYGNGTVYSVNTDGTGFTVLHVFTAGYYDNRRGITTNSDGYFPHAGLVLSGDTLYGTASRGGDWDDGTVFALKTDGTGFITLHSFNGVGVAGPSSSLVLSGGTLYGVASYGGAAGNGAVFKLNTDGTGFVPLHSFSAAASGTNADGVNPSGSLTLSGNTLYGTMWGGGSSGNGTVFAVNTDGTGFTVLHSFSGGTNSDGANPDGSLLVSGHTLYGAAAYGGVAGNGTLFSISLPIIQPQLTMTVSGASVVLTWPTNASGFSLQSAPAATGTFTKVTAGASPFTNPISGGRQFFRLVGR